MPSPHPATDEFSRRKTAIIVTGLLLATAAALLGNTLVYTALPPIMADLSGSAREYPWVITSSLLMMTISLAIWGKLSDVLNKKLLVQVSILLSVIGSLAAGFAISVEMLMAARAVQGVAMGGLMALTQSILGVIVAPRERGRYLGYMGATLSIATASGPVLGGIITDLLGWQWAFFFCIPLPVVGGLLIQATLKLDAPRGGYRPDFAGMALITIVTMLPVLWLTFAGTEFSWVSWQSGALLCATVAATVLTVVIELRAPDPILPIRVLLNRSSVLVIVASVPAGLVLFGSGVFLTQYFQLAAGHTPTMAGLLTIPLVLAQAVSAVIGGRLITRSGRWKPVLLSGTALMLLGLLGLAMIGRESSYLSVAVPMTIMGIGIGVIGQNLVLAVQNTVGVDDVGAASGTVSFFRSLGGAVGIAAIGALQTKAVNDSIRTQLAGSSETARQYFDDAAGRTELDLSIVPEPMRRVIMDAFADSFSVVFSVSAAVSAVALIAIVLAEETRLRRTIELD